MSRADQTILGNRLWRGGPDPVATPWVSVGTADYVGAWTGTVRYAKDAAGDTELDGSATGGTMGGVITYLPQSHWPLADRTRVGWLTSSDAPVAVTVASADGAVTIAEISGSAYSAYTPTWAASGTAPAIGNADILSRYTQNGRTIHAYGYIAFGSSSTFGTGSYTFALPVNASQTYLIGATFMFDNSTGYLMHGIASTSGASVFSSRYGVTYGGLITDMGQLAPFIWAQGDVFAWNIHYETAA